MMTHEEVVNRILEQVSTQLTNAIKDSVTDTVKKELSSSMTQSLLESQFYQYVNEEMRKGLKNIFREISSVGEAEASPTTTPNTKAAPVSHTQELFSHTTQQIDEVRETLLAAAESILAASEEMLEMQEKAGTIIAGLQVPPGQEEQLAQLDAMHQKNADLLNTIILNLSFQDLTGQRLKKVATAIGSIRETVFDLYVSTGLMMQQSDHLAEKKVEQIQEESRNATQDLKSRVTQQPAKPSELKGPVNDVTQTSVDDLLASLGL